MLCKMFGGSFCKNKKSKNFNDMVMESGVNSNENLHLQSFHAFLQEGDLYPLGNEHVFHHMDSPDPFPAQAYDLDTAEAVNKTQ